MRRLVCIMMVWIMGCSSHPESPARARYNDGIAWMAEGDLDEAATSFIGARNAAKGDQNVRYSAAFNLGMLHVRKADELELSEPEKALEQLAQARHWFQDAARVRSDDEDARANLQIVGRKAEVLADQINQGENTLEARLDRVIEDQRTGRDQVRELMEAVKASGTEADPIAFRKAFIALATTQRVLMAETGTISDLAADELAGLDGQVEEEMEQQDRMRQVQLRNLDHYLQSARVAIDDGRRALRKLDGRRSHSRTTAALAHLKRAREQLLDPVSALKAVAQDQQLLLSHTNARLELGKQQLTMPGEEKVNHAELPAWLSADHLAERQVDTLERTSQVLAQFQAAKDAPPPEDPSAVDPKTARALEMAGKALPFLESSVAAMQLASERLEDDAMAPALDREREAMRDLLRAIEHFSDLRNLIELTYAEHMGAVAMLDPEGATKNPALAEMTEEKRAEEASSATLKNIDRLQRMTALIQEELAQAKAQAAQAQAQAGGQTAPDGADDSAEKTYALAEQHRAAAANQLALVSEALRMIAAGEPRPEGSESLLALAESGQEHLEELRRIFYTIIEHLKELHRDQSDTYDETGTAQGAEDEERISLLPPLTELQGQHALLAEALAGALEQQADAASGSEDPQAAQEAEKFSGAAAEVRLALDAMKTASTVLSEALAAGETMSIDLSRALEDQPLAIEHLAAAIAILEPPQDQEQQDQDEQDQDQEQQDQEQQEEEVSKQQAEKRLQEIRDREAARQRDREEGQRVQSGGVEKDW